MAKNQERRSLPLQKIEWKHLEQLAERFQTVAPTGTSKGSPSWRSLIKAIAKGNLIVCETYEVEAYEAEENARELQEM